MALDATGERGGEMLSDGWIWFLKQNWTVMPPHRPIAVPEWLPHPQSAGFAFEPMAEAAGQIADWVKPFPDGSRVHVHVRKDGSLTVHRDRWDPKSGFIPFLLHGALETKTGKVILASAALAAVIAAAAKVLGSK